MKRAILALLFVSIAVFAAWSQPKVAVLDAIIPQNMDPSVIIPVTEKIAERLVVSGRFTVLDRANIESVLKEREFQVSGMVSDQDVVTAGKYLGADFVVVAKVTKVSDTYFISAKMIAIKTGVIANQTSAQGEGKLSALIALAEQVGEVLSGGAVLAQSAAGGQKDISKPDEGTGKAPETKAKVRAPSSTASSRFVGAGFAYSLDTLAIDATHSTGTYTGSDAWNLGDFTVTYAGKYTQFGIGYLSSLSATTKFDNTSLNTSDSQPLEDKESFLVISALLKYPVSLGSVSLFPLGGIEYDLNLSYKDSNGNDLKTGSDTTWEAGLNHLFLQVGAGAAFNFGKVVVSPEFVFGWKVKTSQDTAIEDHFTGLGWDSVSVKETKLDFGLLVGVQI